MKDEIILYDYDGSPCARRVKIALTEKGLPYSLQTIDLAKMQQKSPEYLAINPNGLVPTLSHNGRIIFESAVINDYLEDQFPKIRLSPASLSGKMAVQKWQTYELAMAKIYRPLMYSRVMGPLHHVACTKTEFLRIAAHATDNPAHIAWEEKIWDLKVLTPDQQRTCERDVMRFADLVETSLVGKRFLVEEQFSFADIAVYPRLAMFANLGLDLNKADYPNINRWMAELSARYSFKSTRSPASESMRKLYKFGITQAINRVVYPNENASVKDKLIAKAVKPILRKALKIDAALDQSKPAPIYLVPKEAQASIPPMHAISLKGTKLQPKDKPVQLTAYGFSGSPICLRLKLILKASGLDYQWHEVDMRTNEQKSADYLKLNPMAELPMLKVNETLVPDSLFMAEYIDSLSDKLDLFASTAWELAKIRMWNAYDMGMHKEFGQLFHHYLATQTTNATTISQAKAIITEKLQYLENHLKTRQFLVGKGLNYADIIVFTRLQGLEWVDAADCLEGYSSIAKWREMIASQFATLTSDKPNPPKSNGAKTKDLKQQATLKRKNETNTI